MCRRIGKNQYGKAMKGSFIPQSTKAANLTQWTSVTELRVICAIAGEWVKLTLQSRGLIPIRRKLSRKVEIPNTDIHELSESTAFQPVSIFARTLCVCICSLHSFLIPPFTIHSLSRLVFRIPALVSRSVPRV